VLVLLRGCVADLRAEKQAASHELAGAHWLYTYAGVRPGLPTVPWACGGRSVGRRA
jgi:hypothetical protein